MIADIPKCVAIPTNMSKSKKKSSRTKQISLHYVQLSTETNEANLTIEAFAELFEKAEGVYRSLTSNK